MLTFYIDGTIEMPCDRCLEPYNQSVFGDYEVAVKFRNDDTIENEDEDDERSTTSSSQSTLDMQKLGNKIIMQAALTCGATEPMMDIQWKSDRIVVTVDTSKDANYEEEVMAFDDYDEDDDALLDSLELNGELDDLIEYEDDNIMYDDGMGYDVQDIDEDEEEYYQTIEDSTTTQQGDGTTIDLTLIARTINDLLAADGEDSPSFRIAKLHEIEVTTPPFDNVLRGRVMFENYKGFDVIVEHYEEPKKKKKKVKPKSQKNDLGGEDNDSDEDKVVEQPKLTITEGKLIGRDYEKEVTMVNVKGRVVKIKNDMIESVSLPKPKREKGVK